MTKRKAKTPSDGPLARPIRTAMLRGLAVVLPPLLTIALFLWAFGLIRQHVYDRVYGWTRDVVVWNLDAIRSENELPEQELRNQKQAEANPALEDLLQYRKVINGKTTYVDRSVYEYMENHKRVESMPETAKEICRRYVELRYLPPVKAISYFLCGFILVLYLLGKFMAAGAGRFFYGSFERGITRVPFVRNVYSSVKQVSDFLLSDQQIEYSRVVAVEWPRKEMWCLALVTGSGLKEVKTAIGEEVLSMLIPTSPFPMTGFTVSVKKSETIDLDITIDQAIQFIVSCGVVVPSSQLDKMKATPEDGAELVAAGDSSESTSENG